jgi:hypothetical protein
LQRVGFRVVRQGKHIVMSDGIRILTIPRHNPVNALHDGRHRPRYVTKENNGVHDISGRHEDRFRAARIG